MFPSILHYLGLGVSIAGAVAIVVLLVIAVTLLQRARSGLYYVVREESRSRGLRLLVIAVALIPVSAGVFFADYALNRSAPVQTTPTPRATAVVVLPSLTVSPTPEAPTDTPTPRPTATPLPVPTATATPTRIPPTDLPPTLLTPLPSAVPAEEKASFGPVTFGAGFANIQLTGITDVFWLDQPIVHATFLVRNMNRDAAWTAAWYHEGKYIAGDPLLWNASPNTVGHVYYGPKGGFKGGKWELRLYIEDRLMQKATFTILNVTTTPTSTPSPTVAATPNL
jgi:hypothetical protein